MPTVRAVIKQAQYGTRRDRMAKGVPSSMVWASWPVMRRRGIMPMVAKVKNMDEKKKRKPWTSSLFAADPWGLKRSRSRRVMPRSARDVSGALSLLFSSATIVLRASMMSAFWAMLVLS